jgi:hypothetical protein
MLMESLKCLNFLSLVLVVLARENRQRPGEKSQLLARKLSYGSLQSTSVVHSEG